MTSPTTTVPSVPPLDARIAELAASPGRTWGAADALFGILVVPLSILVTVAVLAPLGAPGVAFLALGSALLVAGVALAVRRPVRQSGGLWGALGVDRPRRSDLWLVVLFTLVVSAAQAAAATLLALLVPALRGVAADNTSVLRGLMLRVGFWPAALISSLVFGLLHGQGTGLPAVPLIVATGVFGLGLCLLVRRTGRLAPAVLAHALRNAVAMAVVLASAL